MAAKPEERDVVIVGSGPAGCATAVSLHNIDPALSSRVLVIDALRHPREKICAGGVNSRASQLLVDLGLRVEVPWVIVDRTWIRTVVDDKWQEVPEITRVTRRDQFDAAVAAGLPERGIELREGVRVERVRRHGNKFEIETTSGTIRASCVVGADGATSIVRKSLFNAPDGTHLVGLATCPAPGHFSHEKKAIMLDFRDSAYGARGYKWVFPFLNDGEQWANVGICEWVNRFSVDLKEDIASLLKSLELDPEKAHFRYFPERPFHPNNPFWAPGVLLVGEAAGICPFFGEGISYGIEYGMFAADTLSESMRSDDYSFEEYMSNLKWSRLGKTLMVSWLAAQLFFSRFHKALTEAAFVDEQLFYWMGEVLAGRLVPSKKLAGEMTLHAIKNLFKRRRI